MVLEMVYGVVFMELCDLYNLICGSYFVVIYFNLIG
jgi:hypothetical protein